MTGCGQRALLIIAATVSSVYCFAQATGSAGLSVGYIEDGGPDVLHQRESSYSGPSLFGAHSAFSSATDLQLEWLGVGTPDYHIRGVSYWPSLILEASVDQRAYLVAENARFAWDPESGVLDARVLEAGDEHRGRNPLDVRYFWVMVALPVNPPEAT